MRSTWIAVLVGTVGLLGCSFSGSEPGDPGQSGAADGGSDSTGEPADLGPFGQCGPSDNGPIGEINCLGPTADPGAPPLVVLEHAFEIYNGINALHVRLTFNPTFNDNTFGTGSIGWGNKPHKFTELVGSDHARLFLYDSADELVFNVKLDYISEDETAPCGYASLGPFGGDGDVSVGDEAAILGWTTSLDQNLNARGYCLTTDSPETTAHCEPSPLAPDWDFRVVYDLWVTASAFAPAGFGYGQMESVHASPAKGESTIDVTPIECPDSDPAGCLDPADGCDDGGGDPCEDVICDGDDVCSGGECVPMID